MQRKGERGPVPPLEEDFLPDNLFESLMEIPFKRKLRFRG